MVVLVASGVRGVFLEDDYFESEVGQFPLSSLCTLGVDS